MQLGLGLAGGYTSRDGYTMNDYTGHPAGRARRFLRQGTTAVEACRGLGSAPFLTGEHDHDGDYALGDLGGAPRRSESCRITTSRG